MKRGFGIVIVLLAGAMLSALLPAAVRHSVNEDNGLRGWQFLQGDIEIELIQRLPDQTRAMLMKHEFSREVVEQLALSCMFQTIIRHTGQSEAGEPVTIDLTRWRMHHAGRESGIVMKEALLKSWSTEDASDKAKLVVRWGMFPTEQEYLPSDYNWGLTAYGISPGSHFDLDVNWEQGGQLFSGRILDVVCAPDVEKLK